jgi:hypothetical protein
MLEYTFKPSPFTKERILTLEGEHLITFSKGKVEQRIPYSNIHTIHLRHIPNKHDWKVYSCSIISRHGQKLTFFNKSYPRILPKDKSYEYVMFVRELHIRASDKNQNIEFTGGLKSKSDYIGMVIGFAFFIGIGIILLIYGKYAVWIGLLIPIIWLIWLTWTLIKNRPVKYNPLDIPSRLLPKVKA